MKRIIYFFGLTLFVLSCADDKNKITVDQLIGNLEIQQAKRNGTVTKLLSGGYFDFQGPTTMITNIKGEPITHDYKLNGKKISTEGKDPMEFEIVYLNADTIILTSKIGKSKFEFLTVKAKK